MISRLLRKTIGWYRLKVKECDGVRLLNTLNKNDIIFWGMRKKDGFFYVRVSVFTLENAKSVCGGLAEVDGMFGLPFIIYKYRRRTGLLIGTVLGIMLLFYSTLFVWNVDITGNSSIDNKTIQTALDEYGLTRGAFIPKLNVNELAYLLISRVPEISSAAVNIDGTHVCVDIIERKRPPEIADYSGLYNVVAKCDGVIYSMEAYSGYPAVKRGESVTNGQLLIAGKYKTKRENIISVKARGKVMAKVCKEFVYSVPLEYVYRRFTGDTEARTSYNIMGKNFNLYFGSIPPFAKYEADYLIDEIEILFLKLPIIKSTMLTREYVSDTMVLTVDEAKKKAFDAFSSWYKNDIEGVISDTSYEVFYDSAAKSVTLHGKAFVIEDIAIETPYSAEDEAFTPEYSQDW